MFRKKGLYLGVAIVMVVVSQGMLPVYAAEQKGNNVAIGVKDISTNKVEYIAYNEGETWEKFNERASMQLGREGHVAAHGRFHADDEVPTFEEMREYSRGN